VVVVCLAAPKVCQENLAASEAGKGWVDSYHPSDALISSGGLFASSPASFVGLAGSSAMWRYVRCFAAFAVGSRSGSPGYHSQSSFALGGGGDG
jgi:hypothetical protein